MVRSFNWNYHRRFDPPARQCIDLCQTILAMFEMTNVDPGEADAVARARATTFLFLGSAFNRPIVCWRLVVPHDAGPFGRRRRQTK
jgi:hypothetical protein